MTKKKIRRSRIKYYLMDTRCYEAGGRLHGKKMMRERQLLKRGKKRKKEKKRKGGKVDEEAARRYTNKEK